MDFDSIFPLLILLIFFLFPSLLKQITQAGKKSQKNTIFSKIGEKIRLFIKEIEQQRQQQHQSQQDQTNTTSSDIWETLAEEDADYPLEQEKEEQVYEPESIKPFQEEKQAAKPVDYFNEGTKGKPAQIVEKKGKSFKQTPGQTIGRQKSNQLQNAVVWSEILGKPVALREE